MITRKKIKILFAIGRFSVGGAEKLLVKKLEVLDRDKFDPYLLTLFPEQKASYQEKIFLDEFRWKKMNFRSLLDLPSWLELLRFFKNQKFDAVVTALFSANLIARLAAIIAGAPVIIIHEHNIYSDKHRWQIWMDWLLSHWTDKIITDSEAARQFTAKQEGIPLNKFVTFYAPPFADKTKAKNPDLIRQELGLPREAKILLTISRLVLEKGHRYLIDAAKLILEKFPDTYFLIVGWGPLEENLKLQVKNQKLEGRILFPGLFLGQGDIQNILPVADIFIDPSVRTDMPFAIMEALSFGKPVVASAIGDIPIFVQNNKTGFTVPPANAKELAEKILILLKDENARKRMGLAAAKIAEPYTMKQYMDNFENLIINFSNK